jgi:hypothetical protein
MHHKMRQKLRYNLSECTWIYLDHMDSIFWKKYWRGERRNFERTCQFQISDCRFSGRISWPSHQKHYFTKIAQANHANRSLLTCWYTFSNTWRARFIWRKFVNKIAKSGFWPPIRILGSPLNLNLRLCMNTAIQMFTPNLSYFRQF